MSYRANEMASMEFYAAFCNVVTILLANVALIVWQKSRVANLRLVEQLSSQRCRLRLPPQGEVLRSLRLVTNHREEGVLVEVVAFERQDDVASVGALLERLLEVGQQVAEDLSVRFRNRNVRVELSCNEVVSAVDGDTGPG